MSSQITATNQWALFLGSTAIAFSPMAFVFGWIVYPKPPLMIVMTSYALAYVLSATCSSIVYMMLNAIFQFNHNYNGISSSSSSNNNNDALYSDYGNIFSSDGVLAAILPSIFFQFIFRCIFTSLYHNVERVIQISIQRHHQQQQQEEEAVATPTTHQNGTVDSVVGTSNHPTTNDDDHNTNHHQHTTQSNRIDIAKFTLTLNDGSAAIAAAIGFGGMHALTLYGTLLSSEAVHNTTGMLYQNSCPAVPSLVVSAMVTQLFTILQIFWMLFTFFGMRRRLLFHRGGGGGGGDNNDAEETPEMVSVDDENDHRTNRRNHRTSGRWLGNRRSGGNYALLLVLLTHTAAAGVTLFHRRTNGCTIVLPTLLGIVLLTAYLFYSSCGRIYLPTTTMMMNTSRRQRSTSD